MTNILIDIDTRMVALDRASPDNEAVQDLLQMFHRCRVEIGKLRRYHEKVIQVRGGVGGFKGQKAVDEMARLSGEALVEN